MLELMTKKDLGKHANTMAKSLSLIHYRNQLYAPVDCLTGEINPFGTAKETAWDTLSQNDIRLLAASMFNIMFANDSELRAFHFMTVQSAQEEPNTIDHVLVKTPEGMMLLDDTGKLQEPDGSFVANTLKPTLNQGSDKDHVFRTIVDWVGTKDEAESLLRHLATALAPGWSAVKYVLLLGEGRNGKGVLLGMLTRLFGSENISMVPRQEMTKRSPMVLELNGKLMNLVMDGPLEYVKDSGTEKTLVAGEPASIKDLYKSAPVTVQTTALFVEALNREPLARDKSAALQKRIVRFRFDRVFPLNISFQENMWSDRMVGALLALLIDYYVQKEDVATALQVTNASHDLQMEYMLHNSLGLQFLKHRYELDPSYTMVGCLLEDLAEELKDWLAQTNDKNPWDLASLMGVLQPLVSTERKSRRIDGRVRKVRVVVEYRTETQQYLDSLEGERVDETDFEDIELVGE